MTDLPSLITRVEAAKRPSAKLNEAISRYAGTWQPPDRGDPYGTAVNYTGSLDAALTLIPGSHGWSVEQPSFNLAVRIKDKTLMVGAEVWDGKGMHAEARAATPALALVAACLRVLQQGKA